MYFIDWGDHQTNQSKRLSTPFSNRNLAIEVFIEICRRRKKGERIMDAIVEHTEDVGSAFPEEARKIHYNEAPARHIRGTASSREVEALKDEGVEVVALPLPPHRLAKQH